MSDSSDELVLVGQNLPIDSPLVNVDERILQQYSLAELRQGLDDTQFSYQYVICGHISTDDQRKLRICTSPAGYQTSHSGRGRCLTHDSLRIRARSPYTGMLQQCTELQQLFEAFQTRERKLNDLSDELNVARTVLGMMLREFETGKRGKNEDTFKNVVLALEQIRRIAHSMANIQQAESSGVTLQAITAFLWQVSEVLNQELVDPGLRIRVLDRISTECTFVEARI